MIQLDRSYFEKGICRIPDLDSEIIDIDKAVAEYSESFYLSVFGYDFYKSLLAANLTDTTSEYYKVVYGAEWSYNGIYYKWDGLLNSSKQSALADYVFLKYMPEIWQTNTISGIAQGKNEELVFWTPQEQLAKVERHLHEQIQSLYDYIYNSDSLTYTNLKVQGFPFQIQKPNSWGI